MKAILLTILAVCLVAGPVAAQAPQSAGSPVYEPGAGVTAPVLVKDVNPQYTPAAMRARVQGTVTLEGVVRTDGTMGDVRVTESLDPDLDQEAIKAAGMWRFKPGLKDGKPVSVRIVFEMSFTLRNSDKLPLFPAGSPVSVSSKHTDALPATRIHKPEGVSLPVAVKQVKPEYTPEAKAAGIQGAVTLDCVVNSDGSVGDVTVTKSLDAGLDQEAIKAAKQWRFEPGTKDGKPVPVRIALELTFTLR